MVLQELGQKLESAMKKLSAATLVDEEVSANKREQAPTAAEGVLRSVAHRTD